jgi:predicted transcriptional regulator
VLSLVVGEVGTMPKKYRSKIEIMSQILQMANGHSAAKTRLMYGVFLSYEQLKEYLGILVQSGLIELLEDTQTYKTTEKGLKFLKLLEYIEGEFMTNSTTNNPQIRNKH